MAKQAKNYFDKDHLSLGVVFVCMVLLVVIVNVLPTPSAPEPTLADARITTTASNIATEERVALPQRLEIPRLNIDTTFGPTLGLRANGEVEVPENFNEVGWYQYSPVPGKLGPAIVLGHVDSYQGPAVFYSIGQLVVGDEIIITNASGTAATFVVEASEKYEQNSFPTELVYGDIDYEGLRLITCSGWYDRDAERYSHNRVVFARLVK